MNFSQLTAFHAAMTSASLSDAAQKLGRTQPAVSAAIRALEDQLGLTLFQRDGRKLKPVPEAHYLLTEASALLSQMSRVRHTMQSLREGRAGALSIAAMPGPVSMLFPRFVARHMKEDAEITVSLSARSSVQIAELARAQSIDFAFADAQDTPEAETLYDAEILSGRCFVAVHGTHPLAEARAVSLADLDGMPMGALQAGHVHQREVLEAFGARGLRFRPVIESQTFLPILQFVIAAKCCAILDPLTVAHVNAAGAAMADVTIRPLAEDLRYRYAILAPRFRPVSVLAETMRAAWREEVLRLMEELGSEPRVETPPDGEDG
ncbi:LysR family transcriptional regulator [Roseovarius sp. SCSIO 43702]|uniref:LysR family transcriptional regulator n=1 Tax=Roseovarius sp. SCSIO 43702 TaxID=2823043 RepID=UPI001C72B193|nr:LysR family transcriptional regulator [Roseovarius sp. SCSIO 43702]QYX56561.1 LysR family transcriptional regulator [Roseovarius sp. SCSIO 43702]